MSTIQSQSGIPSSSCLLCSICVPESCFMHMNLLLTNWSHEIIQLYGKLLVNFLCKPEIWIAHSFDILAISHQAFCLGKCWNESWRICFLTLWNGVSCISKQGLNTELVTQFEANKICILLFHSSEVLAASLLT